MGALKSAFSANGNSPPPWCSDEPPMCRAPTLVPSPRDAETAWCAATGDDQIEASARGTIAQTLGAVDQVAELRGAGVILQVPGGEAIQLRGSQHPSGLETYVRIKLDVEAAPQDRGWWERWNGVLLNCGGAVVSWGGVIVGGLAEVPSVGASTPLMVAAYVSASATTAQCGLAVAKETSPDFSTFVKGPHGQYVNYADMVLDVVSLAGGVAGAAAALKGGDKLLKLSKYANELEKLPKGQLLKQLERLEQAEKDLDYFRTALREAIATGRIADPAARGASGNLLKRALPIITKSLRKEVFAALASQISVAASTASSGYGGVGGKSWGVVKVGIEVLQEPITSSRDVTH